ncbi:MAG: sulfotransferase [Rhodospirillales bacterium]
MAKRIKRKKKLQASGARPKADLAQIKSLYQAGRFMNALPLVRKIVSRQTTDVDLLNISGLLELQAGSAERAIDWFHIVHSQIPDNLDVSENLGSSYCAARQYDNGQKQFEALLKKQPKRLQAWCNLGSAKSNLGDTVGARIAYETALDLDPNFIPALTNLALLEGQSGARELALEYYHKILLLHPTDGEIYSDLSRFKKFKPNDPDITKMEKLMRTSIISSHDRMYLGYALAKAYEDIGQLDKSIENLNGASALKRASVRFDITDVKNNVDAIIKSFTPDVLKRPEKEFAHQTPVFIVGMPRSGTTLVEQIIASHSRVIGGGELSFLRDVITGQGSSDVSISSLSPNNIGYPVGAVSLSDEDLEKIGQTYLNLAKNRVKATDTFTDKMPSNFFFIGLIKLALPHAKIIHCKRSPLDTCFSCYSIHFPYGQEFSNDLADLGQYYQEYDRLMGHWKKVLGDDILDMSYEHLVQDPKSGTENLLAFCDLEWEGGCLEFHKTERQVTTASAAQVRQPIYKTAVKRWQRYAYYLQPLIDALGPLADVKVNE